MKLVVENHYQSMTCYIYLEVNPYEFIGYDGDKLIKQSVEMGVQIDIKPLLAVPIAMRDKLLKAFVEYASGQNIKTDDDNLIKGKLEATIFHLMDMREFSKKLLDDKVGIKESEQDCS